MTPVTFQGCFGWLHQTVGNRRGVVLCAPWGYEAIGTHQSFRVLADRLAEAGLPTLRFDYPNCGDSLDDATTPVGLAPTIRSIAQAATFLRDATGVSEVVLVGLRLGAVFALNAAAADPSVEHLALIMPVVRGKTFALEQKAFAKVIAAREDKGVARDPADGGIEIEGFRLGRDVVESLASIDLRSVATGPARHVLVAGETGAVHYDDVAARLESLGCDVARVDIGEVAAWRPSTIPAPPPLLDIQAIVAWALTGACSIARRPVSEGRLGTETFVETAIRFGASSALAGILCMPRSVPADEAVLFLNTGANHHIGSGRTSVEHARHLAERGIASLRMDGLGIGDSAWLNDGPLAVIHHDERTADVSRAIDALSHLGMSKVCVIGVCSGAFQAFRAAVIEPRIGRLVLVNPQFWLPLTLDQLSDPTQGTFGATSTYMTKIVSRDAWVRVVTGEVGIGGLAAIAREIMSRKIRAGLMTCAALWARVSRGAEPKPRLRRELDALGARGCRTLLVVSESDPAVEIFVTLRGPLEPSDVLQGFSMVSVPGADHAFATRRARLAFQRLLLDAIGGLEPAYEAAHDALRVEPA